MEVCSEANDDRTSPTRDPPHSGGSLTPSRQQASRSDDRSGLLQSHRIPRPMLVPVLDTTNLRDESRSWVTAVRSAASVPDERAANGLR